jgi:hypothetical protein
MMGPQEVPEVEIRERSACGAHPSDRAVNDCKNRDAQLGAQLGELVHSVMVEQLPGHELVCGSEPAWEHGKGEAVAEQQPPPASGY